MNVGACVALSKSCLTHADIRFEKCAKEKVRKEDAQRGLVAMGFELSTFQKSP